MTKIVGTLGPKSRSVDTISRCLNAGMSGILPLQPLIVCDLCSNIDLSFFFHIDLTVSPLSVKDRKMEVFWLFCFSYCYVVRKLE